MTPASRPAAFVVAALVVVLMGGCSSHPEGFQNACDRVSTALDAYRHGDTGGANDALNSAVNWMDAAYEDTEGSERDAVEVFSEAVGTARSNLDTEEGRSALAAAGDACS